MINGNFDFGGANTNAITRASNKAAANLSVANAGTVHAFMDMWVQKLSNYAKELKSSQKMLDAPVTLIYVENCQEYGSKLGWRPRPMLGTNPKDNLAGTLALVTDIGGYALEESLSQTDEIENKLRTANLNFFPTLMLSSLTTMHFWPNGIDGDHAIQRDLQDEIVINLDMLNIQLDRFYEHRAKLGLGWWKNSTKFITKDNPERLVQDALWTFLLGQLADDARIKVEETIDNARADITIRPRIKSSESKSCVMELKTIRSFRTPENDQNDPTKISFKDNCDWACAGVQQTVAYKDTESLDIAFLCVYDFREADDATIDTHINVAAQKYNVINKRYWIANSHKVYREKEYPL